MCLHGNANKHKIVCAVQHKGLNQDVFFQHVKFYFIFPRFHYLKKMESVWTTCVDDILTVYLHYSQTERKVK